MALRLRLSSLQARALHLAAQGLLAKPVRAATQADVRAAVRRMALLQIDTIHIVARSPYLVLFSRLGAYPMRWLDELLASADLFECWAHEACFAPIEDWGLHRRLTESRDHWFVNRARQLQREESQGMGALLAHVEKHGPVRSADFAHEPGARSGWWGWKKEKSWLEAWLALGELMVARRENFHRVYDLRRRVHPRADEAPLPSAAEARREVIERSLRALGIVQARWIHDYYRVKPRLTDAELGPLGEAGVATQVEVEGWRSPGWIHRDLLPIARKIASGSLEARRTALLSPFDPVVWDRQRALSMFGFDYRLECYTPAPMRKYGYFSLPILRRGELVGRLDAKAHRADGIFEVRGLFLEPAVKPSDQLLQEVAQAIRECADWHGTPRIELVRADRSTRTWRAALGRARKAGGGK
jgi:uncharacterized protein YcaQ